jgi:tRNA(His) guanylyltransferase
MAECLHSAICVWSSMVETLAERQQQYEACYNYQITKKLPLVIRVDGINFARLTKNLSKPYDPLFMKCMAEAMRFTITEMSGAIFGYQQSDEITYVLRNDFELDEEPWYGNCLQDIVSVTASKTTKGFDKALEALEDKLDLVGDPIFRAKAFTLPHIGETANHLIWRQQDCTRSALNNAVKTELGKKLGKKNAFVLLDKKSSVDKKRLLFEYCDIDFDDYSSSYRNGVAIYKVPTIIELSDKESVTRNKWTLNWGLPSFLEEKDFLLNILINGTDIFRIDK